MISTLFVYCNFGHPLVKIDVYGRFGYCLVLYSLFSLVNLHCDHRKNLLSEPEAYEELYMYMAFGSM